MGHGVRGLVEGLLEEERWPGGEEDRVAAEELTAVVRAVAIAATWGEGVEGRSVRSGWV